MSAVGSPWADVMRAGLFDGNPAILLVLPSIVQFVALGEAND
jgi:hypothetical protein